MTIDDLPARTATIRSRVRHPAAVAAAISPDDTDEIHTRVEDGAVVADVERPTTTSLESTVDDYVVALDVATAVTSIVDSADGAGGGARDDAVDEGGAVDETGAVTDRQTNDEHDTQR